MSDTTWRVKITEALHENNETWVDTIKCTLTEDELNIQFDDGYGHAEGPPFTLWTKKRVYFPTTYDGAEGVASVPRHPCNEVMYHIGGE